MNQKKDIYCDIGFWGRLTSLFPSIKMTTDLDELKQSQTVMDWYGLLCRSNLFFDCSVDEFESAANADPYLKDVWKKSTDGRCSLDFSPGAVASMCAGPSKMDGGMYHSLFLTSDDHSQQAYNVGVVNIGSDGMCNHSEIFSDNGLSIKRDSVNDWLAILQAAKAQQNCNSMVIADNYIFKDVNANLYKILDALLPKKLDTVFYLTIFSLGETVDSELEKRKQSLDEKIHDMRPELTVKLEVFGTSTVDFHDRGIITNYLWIEIGAGFNLLKNNGAAGKTTNIHITYPMIVPEERVKCSCSGYWNIIEDAKRCLKSRDVRSSNRLLR